MSYVSAHLDITYILSLLRADETAHCAICIELGPKNISILLLFWIVGWTSLHRTYKLIKYLELYEGGTAGMNITSEKVFGQS